MAAVAGAILLISLSSTQASAGTVPAGFQETTAFSGLTNPTVVKFAPDGKIYVAEKSGLIKVFDGLGDSTATVFADLRTKVHNFWDRGLLGMTLDVYYDQGYPYVYVLYTHDAAIGGTAPRWGSPGATSDGCPSPPGPTGDGCVVSGRLSKLIPQPNGTVTEQVLIEDWCQQYPSHSVGTVEYDPWGALYVSGGDGASFNFTDWGQDGSPVNPCADPPTSGTPTPPSAEGGALRSQDLRSRADPTGLDGTVARVSPVNGSPLPYNPIGSDPEANAARQLATGFRNPFRFTISETGEVWVGDVGWNTWEEINRLVVSPTTVANFGWPCYEGSGRQSGYDSANLSLCETLYGTGGAVTAPYYTYNHSAKVVNGETCPTGSSSIAGLQFNYGPSFPSTYRDALFFTDYSRDCIWVMRTGANGLPDPATLATFDAGAANPVNLQFGPDGALYYPDFDGGRIQRIQYTVANQQPTAVIDANPLAGSVPLTVDFDGRGSTDPDGDPLSYAWDLDNDGQFDDSTSPTLSHTFQAPGAYPVSLRVSDGRGGQSTASVTIDVGNSPPTPTITAPIPTDLWSVGKTIGFSGSAADPEQGTLPASALDWDLILHHCPSNCHTHTIQSFPDIATGSFVAPDHEYPSHLELRLTATDAHGLTGTTSVSIDPKTVDLTLDENRANVSLDLTLNGTTLGAPFTTTLIRGSQNSISAPSPQTLGLATFTFGRWSDGGAQSHNIVVKSSRTIQARFDRSP